MTVKKKVYLRDGRAPIPKKESTSKLMSLIKDKNTKPELILRRSMWLNDLRGYRLHWNKVPGRPDIVFPGKKIAIFVNGCYWHRCPLCKTNTPKTNKVFWENKFEKNVVRDKQKINDLNKLNWQSITLWECEINNNVDQAIGKIKKMINLKENKKSLNE